MLYIQLPMTKQGLMLFKINPRLSSTLVFRDMLGFADLQWWIFSLSDKKYRYTKNQRLAPCFIEALQSILFKYLFHFKKLYAK